MPGRKDYVSIKRNIYRQKSLIFCDLNELFRAFKEQNPTVSMEFSGFCCLKPKWCVLAGRVDTHPLCVCTIQNMKLLLEPLNVSYQVLLKYIVCNTSCREGMIHHHHHVALVARISLTLSRHSCLSFIALGRSSGQHPVSSHSC